MRKMRTMAIARAVAVIGGTIALVTGVTFAQLTSTATLSDNSISSASANLTVSTDGSTFVSSTPGFSFSGIAPGSSSADQQFDLKNSGDVNLGVTVFVTNPSISNLNTNKVHFNFKDTDTSNTYSFTLAQMIANFNAIDNIANGNNVQHYLVNVSLDSDAVTGSSGSTGNFNMVFTGTQL